MTRLGVQGTERRPGTRTTLVPGSAGPALTNACADPELAFWRLPQGPGVCSLKLRRKCGPRSVPSTHPAGRPVTAPRRHALRRPAAGLPLGLCSLSAAGQVGAPAAERSGGPAGRGGAERSARLGAGPARVLPSPHPAPHADLPIRDRQRQDSTTVVCRR